MKIFYTAKSSENNLIFVKALSILTIASLFIILVGSKAQAQTYADFSPQFKDNYSGVNDWITGVSLDNGAGLSFSGGTSDAAGTTFTTGIFSNVGTPSAPGTVYSASITQGYTYTLTVTKNANGTYDNYVFAYIDYNGNGSFTDAGEQIMGSGSSNTTQGVHITGASGTTATATFIAPYATPGTYRMRVVMVCGNTTCGGNYSGPSGSFINLWGDAKDFNVVLASATPCSGTPPSFAVTPSSQSICSGSSGTISLSSIVVSGLTYNWQSSATSGGPYTDVAGGSGATTSSYTTPGSLPSNPTYYVCQVTCSNSGLTSQSAEATAVTNSFVNCYCTYSGFKVPTAATRITNVNLAGLSVILNNNTTNTTSYNTYTSPTADLLVNSNYTLKVTTGTSTHLNNINAWIDWNQNGVFGDNDNEFIGGSANVTNGQYSYTFTVPTGAQLGTTAMRVDFDNSATATGFATAAQGSPGTNSACTFTTVSGETQDYTISVISTPPPCWSKPPVVPICIVTVDSITGKNLIVWEKAGVTNVVDSFIVYKETNIAGIYAPIGADPRDSLSVFLDTASNPQVEASRYELGVKDTCGNLSSLSVPHTTIHLTINQGIGSAVNLIWSAYEGISFGSYNIYRGTSSSTLHLINTIQSTLTTYTDLTPPVSEQYYVIEVVGSKCVPTRGAILTSRSNIVNANNITLGFQYTNIPVQGSIFPNPLKDNATLHLNRAGNYTLSVTDISGRVLKTEKFIESNHTVSFQNFLAGIYIIRVTDSNNYQGRWKVVKED